MDARGSSVVGRANRTGLTGWCRIGDSRPRKETVGHATRAMRSARWVALLAVVGTVLVLTIVLAAPWTSAPAGRSGPGPPNFRFTDATPALGTVFHPGVILGAASNETETLLGGIGVYVRAPEFSLPVLAALRESAQGPSVTNLTPLVNGVFFEGGVYGIAWNGSSWLVAGQASHGGINYGSMVRLHNGAFENLTSRLGHVFDGGGIFAIAWNGSEWLLGGNSSNGPALIAFDGTHSQDLTGRLVTHDPQGWIQLLAWNGFEWLVGGQGVLGTLSGAGYTDLWTQSPYRGEGAYVAGWTGTAWLVGGGRGELAFVTGSTVSAGPRLPAGFDQAVLLIQPLAGGWLVGGKGTGPTGAISPELSFLNGATGDGAVVNLTGGIPSAFTGGEIQGGSVAPALGPATVVLVGEGAYSSSSGYGLGSLAIVGTG